VRRRPLGRADRLEEERKDEEEGSCVCVCPANECGGAVPCHVVKVPGGQVPREHNARVDMCGQRPGCAPANLRQPATSTGGRVPSHTTTQLRKNPRPPRHLFPTTPKAVTELRHVAAALKRNSVCSGRTGLVPADTLP
jgi:hypothetical protein